MFRKRASQVVVTLAVIPLALITLTFSGCGRFGTGEVGTFPHAPVVLISIDTLRSDHLPDYGYQAGSTPAISSLVEEGVLFERAYSHIPLTLPSHLTMFTGLLPGEHGVRDNLGYRFKLNEHAYLPKLLGDAGYATGGAISAFVLRSETGFGREFDFYAGDVELRMNESIGESQRPCAETLDKAKAWLAEAAGKPFFFFLHVYEPHTPYDAPSEVTSRFTNAYDAEIAVADTCVGTLASELRRLDAWDRALVFLVSDHGEGLRDHGEAEHGVLLYREALQVPLVVKLPKGKRGGTRVAAPVALVDLLPSITSLLGLPTPAGLPGRPLFAPAPAEPRAIFAETFYPRLHLGWNELTSVIRGDRHVILGPDSELYDLATDPTERRNLRDTERRELAALREIAKALEKPLNAPMAEDAETMAALGALGYLGGSGLAREGPLPDPKTKIHTLGDYNLALQAISEQEFSKGLALARKLTEANPLMVDAWDLLGLANTRLGFHREALTAYKQAMELTGGTPHLAIAIGSIALELGELDEAERHFRLAVESSPAVARTLLASVASARKDYDAAEREARAALEEGGSRAGPLLLLAQVKRDRGQLPEALAFTDEALAALGSGTPKHSGLYLVRGDILARLERTPEAIEAFRREIELFPWDHRPYAHLAALLVAAEQPAEAGQVLRALLARNPDSPNAFAEAVKSMRVLGDPQTAAKLLVAAKRRFPDNPQLAKL